MEDEVLTAVTQMTQRQAQIATVAPLPSISNRLSIVDFQKLSSDTAGDTKLNWSKIGEKRSYIGNFLILFLITATPGDINQSWQSGTTQQVSVPQVEVTVAGTPPEPGTNLGFESDVSPCHRIRKLGQPLSSHTRGGEVVVPAVTTMDFDPVLGKWCLKNLTGSKSFDQQLEHSVIDVGCLRRGRMRRDSVGASNSSNSSSPNSNLTSPRRWAAKAEELHENEAEPSIFPAVTPTTGNRTICCPRSCSADHLGAIVDILGVPTGAPQFWENPRRLILSAEKKKIEMKRFVFNWMIYSLEFSFLFC